MQLHMQNVKNSDKGGRERATRTAKTVSSSRGMDISQTPYNNLETNIGTPQVEDDYPRPQELDEFTFQIWNLQAP